MSGVFPESPLSSPPATECGCPNLAGRIYHQQGSCTDPVVARFGWYASERDDARKAFSGLAGHFTKGAQTGWTARVSGTVLRRLCVMAMCEPPGGTGLEALAEASDLVAERDALNAQCEEAHAENARLIRRMKDLAGHWQREYASETGWPSRCATELREALEGGHDT